MATEKQLLANIENSKLAGVKTTEGKEKIRFNALKHGLSSKHLVSFEKIFSEDYETYLEILQGFTESLKPTNFFESVLVERMARSLFKLERTEAMEACMFLARNDIMTNIKVLDQDDFRYNRTARYRSLLLNEFYRAKSAIFENRNPKQLDLFCKEGNQDE